MKKTRFTDEQFAFALQQHEAGTSVAEISRKLGIADQTFHRWKKRFGCQAPSFIAATGVELSHVAAISRAYTVNRYMLSESRRIC